MLIDVVLGQLPNFFQKVASGDIEIYNEFSLQHELGLFLRTAVPPSTKVQYERPVAFFQRGAVDYVKKEIDIAVFSQDLKERVAVELKFPRNGQHPEQMFAACCDIAFLEQLVTGGFSAGVFAMVIDDALFRAGRDCRGLYAHFRTGQPIFGTITKPTGKRDQSVVIRGPHCIRWQPVNAAIYYATVEVRQVHPTERHNP
jgi:hypothetical protein